MPLSLDAQCNAAANAADCPEGGYAQSCKGCVMGGALLSCSHCSSSDGGQQASHLLVNECSGEVQNVDGKLVC